MSKEMLEAGSYDAQIVGHDLFTIGSKETPAVGIECKIDETTFRRVLLWMTDTGMEGSVKTLRSLGFTGELPGLTMEHEEQSGLLGTMVRLRIKHAEYNGKPVERINIYPIQADVRVEASAVSQLAKKFSAASSKLQEGGRDEEAESAHALDLTEDEEAAPPPAKTPTKRVVTPAGGKTKVVTRSYRNGEVPF